MKKQEAILKIQELKSQIAKLEEIINKPVDLFSITTYSEVCAELGLPEKSESNFDDEKEFIIHQLNRISKLFNQGSKKNIYYPYFTIKGSGLLFIDSCYFGFICDGRVAYFSSRAISDYVGKTFIDLYTKLHKLNNL